MFVKGYKNTEKIFLFDTALGKSNKRKRKKGMFCYKRSRGSDGGWSLKRERCSQSIFLLLFLFQNSTDVMMLWCYDVQLNISLIKVCKIPFFWIRKAKLRRSVVLFPLKRGNKRISLWEKLSGEKCSFISPEKRK